MIKTIKLLPVTTLSLAVSACFGLSAFLCNNAAAAEDATCTVAAVLPAAKTGADTASSDEVWSVHGQFTNFTQGHAGFNAAYSGTNSMEVNGRTEETTDITLFAGRRLWRGAELWINAEIDQGYGVSNTLGMAGYPSGEAYKVGANAPYLRLPRLFFRQVIALGGETTQVESAANQLAGMTSADNLTLTAGKFSVADIFDTNSYAHDPRSDFMNWSIIESGAFDYAADVWGYTYGAAAEWTQDWWTLRGGVFQLSPEPNAKITNVDFTQYSLVMELEQRHQWLGHPGKIKLLGFMNSARMGSYQDALQLALQTNSTPNTALVRRSGTDSGLGINIEQELSPDLGVFARLSKRGGSMEAYEFTDINQSISAGLSIKGGQWGRAQDTLGIAGVVNALSGDARAYFAAGGTGLLIGDGQLHYAPEKVLDIYYALHIHPHITLTADYQHAANPAYNQDRGPISFYGVRAHAEF